MALDRTAGVFGPFKAVVAEFISCIEIYEVSVLVSFSNSSKCVTR